MNLNEIGLDPRIHQIFLHFHRRFLYITYFLDFTTVINLINQPNYDLTYYFFLLNMNLYSTIIYRTTLSFIQRPFRIWKNEKENRGRVGFKAMEKPFRGGHRFWYTSFCFFFFLLFSFK